MMQAAIPRQQLQFLHCSLRLPCLLNEFMCNCGVRYNDDRSPPTVYYPKQFFSFSS